MSNPSWWLEHDKTFKATKGVIQTELLPNGSGIDITINEDLLYRQLGIEQPKQCKPDLLRFGDYVEAKGG